MSLLNTSVTAIHLVFAGLWTGSVMFVALAIVPRAADGAINAKPLESIGNSLKTISRVSAVVLFATGGHMAAEYYTAESLTGSPRGHLVLTMLFLWFVLTVLVEIAAKRLTDGASADKVREPGRASRRLFQAAAVVAALLLIDAGALAGGL